MKAKNEVRSESQQEQEQDDEDDDYSGLSEIDLMKKVLIQFY
jgi:hypothetical protein